MEIIKRGTGTASHTNLSKKEVFDPDVRKYYKERAEGMEHVLKGGEVGDMSGTGTYRPLDHIQDKATFATQQREMRTHAEKGAEAKLTAQEKDALWQKAKSLKHKIVVGMVPQHELHPVKSREIVVNGQRKVATVVDNDKMNSTKAVERNKAWYKQNDGNLKELRRICRILDPDTPEVGKIVDKWRPK